jgi:transketolase C-terminal domain/subunit
MTVPTTERPAYGSVDRYAQMIRDGRFVRSHTDVYTYVVGLIEVIVEGGDVNDTARIARVRNALAAAELVRGELAAR